MKGEYVEQQRPKVETTSMFSKLQQQHSQPQAQHQQPQPQSQPHPFGRHPFQLSHECQNSAEDDSRSSGGAAAATNTNTSHKPNSSGDGASIEVVRRPRGRPPGSKNKPKPPVIITRDPEPAMSPYILEVSGGCDVVEAIARFTSRKNTGLCVLNGSGTVANVTLRQPSTTPGGTVTFHGRFDILSLSATFLPSQLGASPPSVPNGFSISLAGPQGQIVGGFVAGSLIAAGTVFVIAASFNNLSYHRLALPEEDVRNSVSGGGDCLSPPFSGSGGGESGHAQAQAESCGMSMYSCHLPSSDVIWAPTARPPPPPPPY